MAFIYLLTHVGCKSDVPVSEGLTHNENTLRKL